MNDQAMTMEQADDTAQREAMEGVRCYAEAHEISEADIYDAWEDAKIEILEDGIILLGQWTAVGTLAVEIINGQIVEAAAAREQQDRRDQVWALTHGWTVERHGPNHGTTGGWFWIDTDGECYSILGELPDLPTWPDEARAAVARERGSAA